MNHDDDVIYYTEAHNIRGLPSEKWLRRIVIDILEKCISPAPSEKLIEELENVIKNYIASKLTTKFSSHSNEE